MNPSFPISNYDISDFDYFEIHGCKKMIEPGSYSYIEHVDDENAEFWTVYGCYIPTRKNQYLGFEALVDCVDRESAEIVRRLLNFAAKETGGAA